MFARVYDLQIIRIKGSLYRSPYGDTQQVCVLSDLLQIEICWLLYKLWDLLIDPDHFPPLLGALRDTVLSKTRNDCGKQYQIVFSNMHYLPCLEILDILLMSLFSLRPAPDKFS